MIQIVILLCIYILRNYESLILKQPINSTMSRMILWCFCVTENTTSQNVCQHVDQNISQNTVLRIHETSWFDKYIIQSKFPNNKIIHEDMHMHDVEDIYISYSSETPSPHASFTSLLQYVFREPKYYHISFGCLENKIEWPKPKEHFIKDSYVTIYTSLMFGIVGVLAMINNALMEGSGMFATSVISTLYHAYGGNTLKQVDQVLNHNIGLIFVIRTLQHRNIIPTICALLSVINFVKMQDMSNLEHAFFVHGPVLIGFLSIVLHYLLRKN